MITMISAHSTQTRLEGNKIHEETYRIILDWQRRTDVCFDYKMGFDI
jgi:hypothetical protein